MTHRSLTPLLAVSTFSLTIAMVASPLVAQEEAVKKPVEIESDTFSGLRARSIGPALTSGRVGDFAVNPDDPKHYFVAVSSGNVWKTVNGGITYEPVFDNYGSYSIGCVEMDPNNSNVVWVGTGENNSQRSVSFGDGVYKSVDGGASWKNMGLKESEHIGMIAIDPRDSDTVYVAAQGPLWRSGGDRGLYKTTDGGKNWSRILHISDDTGVNEILMDPRNPDVLYASAYQRRRHVWTLINGGPESAIYKSTDGGASWRKITRGLPEADKGRIGMAISPANPDVVYAIIEAASGSGGFFRSTDRGETWKKRSSYMTSSPQYYNEIFCDPYNVDRVYALDTFIMLSEDGGANFNRMSIRDKHVDDHALWIDPDDTDHLLVGSDGGIYETYDRGGNWHYKQNLPVTQFYKMALDNSEPFYYVYGGTQDNNTQGGPARTLSRAGIPSEEWFITVGGDGFQPRVDPEDPNIVYSQWQYGGLVRHDRRSGENVDIKPREAPGDEPNVWNWDSPLIISPHSHTRLYYGARKLFRSDDRGDSWRAVSDDLTRGLDRNTLEVMGKIQPVEAVSRHRSTSIFGNLVSIAESPLAEDLLYVGTDDGLIQVSDDGGENWRKISLFPGVPDLTYVSYLTASEHDADTIFAAFDNHKMGDFKPYLLKSADRGANWESIAGDLPERNIVYAIQQDHVNPELLFVGAEFGAYYTVDGGVHWHKVKGVPTIAVRDIALQRRENDLVMATFGRGFYVLDDYTPLRVVDNETLEQDAHIFPIKPTLMYIQTSRFGGGGRGSQGASYYTAPNPPYGAIFTYFLKDKVSSRKEKRRDAAKKGGDEKHPSVDELRAEDNEIDPSVMLIIRDEDGEVIRRIDGSRSKGVHRATWDLRYPSSNPISLGRGGGFSFFRGGRGGPMVTPGTYTVEIVKQVDGEVTTLTEPEAFEINALELASFSAEDKAEVLAFNKKVARLQRAVQGTSRAAGEVSNRIAHLRKAVIETPAADESLVKVVEDLRLRLNEIQRKLSGDRTLSRLSEPATPSISQRMSSIVGGWYVTSPPTQTHRDQYRYAGEEFSEVWEALRKLMEEDLKDLEDRLEALGAPWTPGRLPKWDIE